MNIQIFGTKKCSDTRKAERFFKERGIKFQMINLAEKDISKGELTSVIQSVGSLDAVVDAASKDKEGLSLLKYTPDELKLGFLLENQNLIKTPIVRDGKRATVGDATPTWKKWVDEEKNK